MWRRSRRKLDPRGEGAGRGVLNQIHAVRARAAEFERAASPWLDGLGHYSSLEAPPALGWYWNRTSCCLWYQTTSGSYCEDCSLHDPADLAARRLSAIHGGTSA